MEEAISPKSNEWLELGKNKYKVRKFKTQKSEKGRRKRKRKRMKKR